MGESGWRWLFLGTGSVRYAVGIVENLDAMGPLRFLSSEEQGPNL